MPALTLQRLADEDLFTLIGMQSIPDGEKEELALQIGKTVHARVFKRIYDELDGVQQKKLDELEPELMLPYLSGLGYDLPALVVEEGMAYKVELAQYFQLAVTPLAA